MINLYKDLASLRPHWTIKKAEWLEIKKQIKNIQACYNQASEHIKNLSCGQDDYYMDQSSDYAKSTIKDIKKMYPWLSRLGNQDELMNKYFWSNSWTHFEAEVIKNQVHKKPKMGFRGHINTLSRLLENAQEYCYAYVIRNDGIDIHSSYDDLNSAIECLKDSYPDLIEYNNGKFLKCYSRILNGSRVYYVITDQKLN